MLAERQQAPTITDVDLPGVVVRQAIFRRRRRRARFVEWAKLALFVLLCTLLVAAVAISVMGR